MAEIVPYNPDLDIITFHKKSREPLLIDSQTYDELLLGYDLSPGSRLSDVGILRAMEAGLIKIWDDTGQFDLEKQIQGAAIDLRLDREFWYYRPHRATMVTVGNHEEELERYELLDRIVKQSGETFIFHRNQLVLAFLTEGISISNAVIAEIDGRSVLARLGISNHQTAGEAGPGYAGRILMELSNANEQLDIGIKVGERVASVKFTLLDRPSSRPYSLKRGNLAFMQAGPFRFWNNPQSSTEEFVKSQYNMSPNGHNINQ